MKDLSAWVLDVSDISNLVETKLTKSLKALMLFERLLEVMPAPIKSIGPECEALVWLDPSPASLISQAISLSGTSAVCVLSEDISTGIEVEAFYLLLLFKALTPSSSASLASSHQPALAPLLLDTKEVPLEARYSSIGN